MLSGLQVLVHSDLHEGNIVRTERGAAFLDFGCAFMGVALWDFAALAFFLG
jgi:Ser/Thr protein kinase RdoA (MazF antagonist)